MIFAVSMSKLKISFAILSISLLFSACSEGGRRSVDGRFFCVANYNPLPLSIKNAQKLSLKPEDGEIPAGEYTFEGADFFVKDTQAGGTQPIQIHVREDRNKFNNMENSTVCASGLQPSMTFEHESTGIAKMTVQENGKIDFQTRIFAFSLDQTHGLRRTFTDGDKTTDQPPSKVYDGKPGATSEYYLFKKSNTAYEIRAVDTFADGMKYFLSTRLKRVDLAPVQ